MQGVVLLLAAGVVFEYFRNVSGGLQHDSAVQNQFFNPDAISPVEVAGIHCGSGVFWLVAEADELVGIIPAIMAVGCLPNYITVGVVYIAVGNSSLRVARRLLPFTMLKFRV